MNDLKKEEIYKLLTVFPDSLYYGTLFFSQVELGLTDCLNYLGKVNENDEYSIKLI